MPLESASYISDLVTSNPAASDGMNNADDHMRLIKSTVKNSFPGVSVPATRGPLVGGHHGFLADAGSAAAPAFAFIDAPTLGFYGVDFANGEFGFTGTLRGKGAVPTGAIMDFAGGTPPDGWAACDGASVAVASYPALFVQIGYAWGGSGANFNLPNLINRYRRHRDNSTVSGGVGNLQADQTISHTHTGSVTATGTAAAAGSHTHTATVTDPGHTHVLNAITDTATSSGGGPLAVPRLLVGTNSTVTNTTNLTGVTVGNSTAPDHTHTVSASGSFTTAAQAGAGTETRPLSATVLTCIKL